MSLQVWLPLNNGSLKQQGISNESATINGTVVLTDSGKIGKCATFGTAQGNISLPASTMTSFSECSVAFWLRINDWNTDHCTFFKAGGASFSWVNYIFGVLRDNNTSHLCFVLTNSSNNSTQNSYRTSLELNTSQWYHLAFTYKAGEAKIYIDGELDSEYSTSYVPNFAGITDIRIGSATGNYKYQTKSNINDVKIFSHCLSQREISELKKMLILHYPLDGNNGTLTNENLIINSGQPVQSAKSSNGSAYTNANAHLFSDYGTELFINNTTDEFTISYDYEVFGAESQEGHSAYIHNQVNGAQVAKTTVYLTSASETGHASFTAKLNTTQAEHSNRPFKLRFRLRYAVDGAYFIVKNVKLEKGTIATPWCPSPEDALYTALGYNDGIEYDTSGYKNNATGANNLSYSLDSPRYLASAVCNYNNGLTIPKIFADTCNNQHMSFAFWLKRTADFEVNEEDIYNGIATIYIRKDYNNNPYRLFISWNHATDDSVKTNTWTMYNTPLDTWVHIVITFDSGVLKTYVNGKLFATSDKTATGTYMQGNRGTSLGNITGQLSDFRIYATALSAEDIQKLYTVSASIDSNGNAYSASYVEG